MEIKTVKFGWRVYLASSLRKITEVTGVNSKIDENTHGLMWDFDDVPLHVVIESLEFVQNAFNLPPIIILQTKELGYHAYCFRASTFIEARGIIAFTPNVDKNFLAIGIGRGYFTLRFTDVPGREFKSIMTLPSDVEADLDYKDFSSFVKYTKAVQ